MPIHVASDFYDVDGFKAGAEPLRAVRDREVGSVDGLDLVHLQCHFGLDTLSWARLGAPVDGPRLLASRPSRRPTRWPPSSASTPTSWPPTSTTRSTPSAGGSSTSSTPARARSTGCPTSTGGPRWSTRCCGPGGFVYLAEFHPFTEVFGDEELTRRARLLRPGRTGIRYERRGTYIDDRRPVRAHRVYEWNHPVSRVIAALLDQGLALELFHEHPHTLYRGGRSSRSVSTARTGCPTGMPQLPLMYSLKMRKAA